MNKWLMLKVKEQEIFITKEIKQKKWKSLYWDDRFLSAEIHCKDESLHGYKEELSKCDQITSALIVPDRWKNEKNMI